MAIIAADRYRNELLNLPPSGGGGAHAALLRVANIGRIAGKTPEQIARDLAAYVHGSRRIPLSEINAAVNKAFITTISYVKTPRPDVDGQALLNAILQRGAGCSEADLWEMSSPVRPDWPVKQDAAQLLQRLYHLRDRLFIGSRHDSGIEHVLPCWRWVQRFEQGGTVPPHVIPNPMTGEQGKTKDGKPSFRADSCVAQFRFCIVEFDSMPRQQQIEFWAGAPLPVSALIDSGGKSIHAWVRIDAANAAEWEERVERRLFSMLNALGVDSSCRNEARLSRLPGHFREETGNWQRILYLNPAGGQVQP